MGELVNDNLRVEGTIPVWVCAGKGEHVTPATLTVGSRRKHRVISLAYVGTTLNKGNNVIVAQAATAEVVVLVIAGRLGKAQLV